MGSGNGVYNIDFWRYDPVTNTWLQRANFLGGPREEASQFSIGNFGYAGTGYDGLVAGVTKKDFWQYNPNDSTTGIYDLGFTNYDLKVFPNPFSVSATVKIISSVQLENAELKIYSLTGQELVHQKINSPEFEIQKGSLSHGNYFAVIFNSGKEICRKKIVVQ